MSSIKNTFQSAVKAAVTTAAHLLPAKKNAPPATPSATAPVTTKKPGPDPAPTMLLLAWRTPGLNPHLLVAYKPGTDPNNPNNLVTVNVRSNSLFIPHMKLNVRHVTGTIYDLVGPLPRWRGRW